MNTAILTPSVQSFLQTHAQRDPADIALQKSPFDHVKSAELAVQIESRQKAKKKLPTWYAAASIYWPAPIAIEQSSSEQTAAYKASLLPGDKTLIDLTGGFGVDTFYFAQVAKQVIHCEINPELSAIAAYNLSQLGAKNIEFRAENGLEVLKQRPMDTVDVAYIDPSRRTNKKKVFLLSDCTPDVVAHQHLLRTQVQTCVIKTSPLLDIQAALSQLDCVKAIHIISVQNEVKELLLMMERKWNTPPSIVATRMPSHQPATSFSFHMEEEKQATATLGDVCSYLYEPDASLMKAGCFKLISERWQVQKLHPHTHLYTADHVIPDFPGKIYQVEGQWNYSAFKKQKQKRSASIVSKNFPLKAESLRKKHAIKEDPNHFLFFFKDKSNQLKTVWAKRCVF